MLLRVNLDADFTPDVQIRWFGEMSVVEDVRVFG